MIFKEVHKRFKKLEKIVKPYKSKKGENYDCIVPVTGANDSYFIVHIVKNKLGLNLYNEEVLSKYQMRQLFRLIQILINRLICEKTSK